MGRGDMIVRDLEELCRKLRNGEYDGKDIMQVWIAIEELISLKENTFRYDLNQEVRVQVFSFIKIGVIVERSSYETTLGINFKYTVKYGEGHEDCIDVWEKDLHLIQKLPYVGII